MQPHERRVHTEHIKRTEAELGIQTSTAYQRMLQLYLSVMSVVEKTTQKEQILADLPPQITKLYRKLLEAVDQELEKNEQLMTAIPEDERPAMVLNRCIGFTPETPEDEGKQFSDVFHGTFKSPTPRTLFFQR